MPTHALSLSHFQIRIKILKINEVLRSLGLTRLLGPSSELVAHLVAIGRRSQFPSPLGVSPEDEIEDGLCPSLGDLASPFCHILVM